MKKSSKTYKTLNFFYMDKLDERVFDTGEIDSCWLLRWFPVMLVIWGVIAAVAVVLVTATFYPYVLLFGNPKYDLGMLIFGCFLNFVWFLLLFAAVDSCYDRRWSTKIGNFFEALGDRIPDRSENTAELCKMIAAMAHRFCIKVPVEPDDAEQD